MAKVSRIPDKHTLMVRTEIEVYASAEKLPKNDQLLLAKAKLAVKNAYAPYSHFQVGAAVRLQNGKIILGNNQENAAYPSGLCAERVAIFQAGALYPNVAVKSIAISCKSIIKPVLEPVTPCGACRQSIAEYELRSGKPIRIIMSGEKGAVYVVNSISSLLPLLFNASILK
ncbi:MAG: cytidine deaminase [Sediminibacterium sp.]|nr:cytidine deaminase [Sediminibacterium sp.]